VNRNAKFVTIYGPKNGKMEKFVKEGLTSEATITFYDGEKLLYGPSHAKNAGLEVQGDIEWIKQNL
jgi:hypothetical protein